MPTGRLPQTGPRHENDGAEARIKGAGFIEILKWYTQTQPHGVERIQRAVAQMPPECRQYITRPEQLTLGLLVGTWYPAELVRIVFQEMIVDLTPPEARQLALDAVKASVGTTLSGIYKSFMRLLVSPSMLAEHYQKIWGLYHSTGRFYVVTHSPTHQEFQLHDWPAHDSFLCQMNLYATRLILESIGKKEVTGTILKCVDRGDAYCAYVQKWKS